MREQNIISLVFLGFYFSIFIIWVIKILLDSKRKNKLTPKEFDDELLKRSWQCQFTYEESMRKHCLELSKICLKK